MALVTQVSASNLRDAILDDDSGSSKCAIVLPQFSQESLMDQGCTGKYLNYSSNFEDLKCKKSEIARIWEDNQNIVVQD